MFDEALDEVAAWIQGNGWSKVALQFPEGVKSRAQSIIDALSERTGSYFLIMGDPCYGACDINRDYRDYADAIVQFGHSPIPAIPMAENVMFVEMRAAVSLGDLVKEAVPLLGERVGLLATLQYLDLIVEAEEYLSDAGKHVTVGKGDSRVAYPGQVLGCNHSSAASVSEEVDDFLFIGEGNFHAIAASLGTGRPVLVLDPVHGELRSMDEVRDRLLRQRFASITSASDAETFLIIISPKIGQRRERVAKAAEELIRDNGRTVYTVVMEEVSPSALIHYHVDAYVSTACPRVAIDDAGMYRRPMLTYPELEIALGVRQWSDYVFDSIID